MTGAAETPARARPGAPRRRRALPFVAAAAAILCAVAAFVRWGLEPEFEGDLVRFLPGDVEAALRCEGAGLSGQRAAGLLGFGGAHDAASAGPLSGLTDAIGGRAAVREVLGRDVVVSVRDGEILVLTRLTRSGRFLADAALAARGAATDDPAGRVRRFDAGDGASWFCARDRDVLAAGMDESLVIEAMAAGAREHAAAGAPSRPALGGAAPAEGHVEAWSQGEFADEWLGILLDDSPASVVLDALPLSESRTLDASLDVTAYDVRLTWTTDFGDVLPADTAALLAPDAAPAEEFLAIARSLAPPAEAVLVVGARIRASEVLGRFVASVAGDAGAAQDAVDDAVHDPGFAEVLAASTRSGAAVVLVRLEEVDRLDVESAAPDAPEIVAGSIVAVRLRDPRQGDAVLRAVAEVLRHVPHGDPRRALQRPAAAVTDDLLVIASHEGLLGRALAARKAAKPLAWGAPRLRGSGGAAGPVVVGEVSGPSLYAHALDLRGNAGRAARPWESASFRRAVALHVRETFAGSEAEFAAAVAAETARVIEARAADAFREGVAGHIARIAPLAEISAASFSARTEGGRVVVELDARLR